MLAESAINCSARLLQVPDPEPVVLVISGPSGVGKDAVLRRLQELRPDLFFVVTATTRSAHDMLSVQSRSALAKGLDDESYGSNMQQCRPKRPGEVDGRDYIFVSKATFEQWIQKDELLEHAMVYGDYKGIPREQVWQSLRLL